MRCRTRLSEHLLAELADALEEADGVHNLEGALLALQDGLLPGDEQRGECPKVRVRSRRREVGRARAQRGQRHACPA